MKAKSRLHALKPSEINCSQVVEWYLARPTAFHPKAAKERARILKMFAANFGENKVIDCKPYEIEDWLSAQPGIKSDWTRSRWIASICGVFNAAARLGVVDRNPFQGVARTRGGEGRDLTEEEFQKAYKRATPAFRRFMMFLRQTGARPGEAKRLTTRHVDIENRVCILAEHKTAKKTGRPRRIYLNEVAAEILAPLLDQAAPDNVLFRNSLGRAWRSNSLEKNWRKLRLRANLPKDAKLYGCRHMFGTNAILNGVDTMTAATLLGHSGLATVTRYVHLADKAEHLRAAVNKATGVDAPQTEPPVSADGAFDWLRLDLEEVGKLHDQVITIMIPADSLKRRAGKAPIFDCSRSSPAKIVWFATELAPGPADSKPLRIRGKLQISGNARKPELWLTAAEIVPN